MGKACCPTNTQEHPSNRQPLIKLLIFTCLAAICHYVIMPSGIFLPLYHLFFLTLGIYYSYQYFDKHDSNVIATFWLLLLLPISYMVAPVAITTLLSINQMLLIELGLFFVFTYTLLSSQAQIKMNTTLALSLSLHLATLALTICYPQAMMIYGFCHVDYVGLMLTLFLLKLSNSLKSPASSQKNDLTNVDLNHVLENKGDTLTFQHRENSWTRSIGSQKACSNGCGCPNTHRKPSEVNHNTVHEIVFGEWTTDVKNLDHIEIRGNSGENAWFKIYKNDSQGQSAQSEWKIKDTSQTFALSSNLSDSSLAQYITINGQTVTLKEPVHLKITLPSSSEQDSTVNKIEFNCTQASENLKQLREQLKTKQAKDTKTQGIDRLIQNYFPGFVITTLAISAIWFHFMGIGAALQVLITTLMSVCPCCIAMSQFVLQAAIANMQSWGVILHGQNDQEKANSAIRFLENFADTDILISDMHGVLVKHEDQKPDNSAKHFIRYFNQLKAQNSDSFRLLTGAELDEAKAKLGITGSDQSGNSPQLQDSQIKSVTNHHQDLLAKGEEVTEIKKRKEENQDLSAAYIGDGVNDLSAFLKSNVAIGMLNKEGIGVAGFCDVMLPFLEDKENQHTCSSRCNNSCSKSKKTDQPSRLDIIIKLHILAKQYQSFQKWSFFVACLFNLVMFTLSIGGWYALTGVMMEPFCMPLIMIVLAVVQIGIAAWFKSSVVEAINTAAKKDNLDSDKLKECDQQSIFQHFKDQVTSQFTESSHRSSSGCCPRNL
ncbi:hypothetical protein N9Y17_00615 [Gammaproteobacteria bacterium]|nr:hypothetical protein [Gammaproteobacteria bacterium]